MDIRRQTVALHSWVRTPSCWEGCLGSSEPRGRPNNSATDSGRLITTHYPTRPVQNPRELLLAPVKSWNDVCSRSDVLVTSTRIRLCPPRWEVETHFPDLEAPFVGGPNFSYAFSTERPKYALQENPQRSKHEVRGPQFRTVILKSLERLPAPCAQQDSCTKGLNH